MSVIRSIAGCPLFRVFQCILKCYSIIYDPDRHCDKCPLYHGCLPLRGVREAIYKQGSTVSQHTQT